MVAASCQLKSTTKEDRMRLGKVKKGEGRGEGGGRSLLCEQDRPRVMVSSGIVHLSYFFSPSPFLLLLLLREEPRSLNSRERERGENEEFSMK